MFRIPLLSEIVALFLKPQTFEGAIGDVATALARLDEFHGQKTEEAWRKAKKRQDLEDRAKALLEEENALVAEAERALRVAERFEGLLK